MFDIALVVAILDIRSTQKPSNYYSRTVWVQSNLYIFFHIPKGDMLKLCPVVTVIYFSDF